MRAALRQLGNAADGDKDWYADLTHCEGIEDAAKTAAGKNSNVAYQPTNHSYGRREMST
jgi:hypothetical protein